MVAAIVSKTIGEIRRGSIPLTDTNLRKLLTNGLGVVYCQHNN